MPTIGVSIAIPEPYGEQLQKARASFGDPAAASIPTHVTLLPPTSADDGLLEEFVAHLEKVCDEAVPFPMVLRGTGTFRPLSPVVFVQVSQGIAECEVLEQALHSGPLERDLDFYYHPHVTVAHDVPDENLDEAFDGLAGFECSFTVSEVHLYEHGDDEVWRPVRAFALRG